MEPHKPGTALSRWYVLVPLLLVVLLAGFFGGMLFGQRDSEPAQAIIERLAEAATPHPTRTPRPTRTPVPTATPVPSPTPVPTPTINFSITTAALWSQHKNATELQWPVYVDSLTGMRVAWQGKVLEVSSAGVVKLDPEDVQFPVADLVAHELSLRLGKGGLFAVAFSLPKEEAVSLSKDQLVAFEGRIESVAQVGATVIYVTLEDVRLMN